METKEVKLYVMAAKHSFEINFHTVISTSKWATDEQTTVLLLSEVTVDVEIPDIDEKRLTLEEVKQLENKIKEEKDASYIRITAIEEKIQSLLCIEQGE